MIDGFSEAFLAIIAEVSIPGSWTNIHTLSLSESSEGVKYRLTVRHTTGD